MLTTTMPAPVTQEVKCTTLELLQAFQEEPSAVLRNRLVQMNLGLVRKEAHRWVSYTTESYEDLVQVGSMGLMRAIERFDVTKGHAFSSFAMPYIRGEIQHYLRDKSPQLRIPRRWQALQRQGVEVAQQLREELQRQPSEAEIASALEVSIEDWQQAKLAFHNRSPISLDAPVNDDEAGSSLGDVVPDQRYRSFQLAQEDRMRLQQALQTLEKRTRQVVEFVFFHDLTQKETAELLGLSAVTVSRQVKKGLSCLREEMGAQEGDELF
jgi:RNA polymerase sigma-B factor